MSKVFVIGLDAAPPKLVFEDFKGELPNLAEMMDHGVYGPLESCDPPITIPAWAAMATSRNPGALGLYGFRHRKRGSYAGFYVASSLSVKEETVWDILSRRGLKSCVIGVPPSYPPKPLNGLLVSCFITPDATKEYTYPPSLKPEVERLVGEYVFDVKFRTEERDKLLRELYEMTEKRFKLVKHLLTAKKWDFFMFVEIGVDRIQHAFWKYYDETHKRHVPNHPYKDAIKEYYKRLDAEIGRILKLLDEDTAVIVVSDHGAKRMDGALCINEWLIQEGWMKLKEEPKRVVDLEEAKVDWGKTKAWGWGGYYARVFLNVKGREPNGVIKPGDFEEERENLRQALMEIRGPSGRRMDMKVYKPEEIYPVCRGDYPDLMVYFDDLYWRSAGTLGHGLVHLPENDKGPDDAVHAREGIFIVYDKAGTLGKREGKANVLDVAPTVLSLMGIPIPSGFEGKTVEGVS